MTTIKFAETDEEIDSFYPVMSELLPHIVREDFGPHVKRQMNDSGFQLIYLMENDQIKAVAGIRVAEWIARGNSLDLEYLVSKEHERSKGYG